ncbi:hypothetical protein MBANPS3_002881 [Mucor bainieri]
MKLRSRTKRAVVFIERYNPLSSTFKRETDYADQHLAYKRLKDEAKTTLSCNVKREETKYDGPYALGKQIKLENGDYANNKTTTNGLSNMFSKYAVFSTLPDDADYYYRCDVCKEISNSLRSVLDHRRSVHDVSGNILKSLNVEPDIHDRNHHCRSCEKTFISNYRYRLHLRSAHHMVLKPLWWIQTNATPDPNDPNFYCSSCKHTYKSKGLYRTHLKDKHRMKLKSLYPITNPNVLPDWNNPDFWCASCDYTFASRVKYSQHCSRTHKMKNPNKIAEIPNINDPDFNCKVCNVRFNTKRLYRAHCFDKHKCRPSNTKAVANDRYCDFCKKSILRQSFPRHLFVCHSLDDASDYHKRKHMKPIIDDPNNYCRVCDMTLSKQNTYRVHLLLKHGIERNSRLGARLKPDINDPNNYCRVCQRTYNSKPKYHAHLHLFHGITTRQRIESRQEAISSDPLDPNWFCCVCKEQHRSLSDYRAHCRIRHQMILAPITRVFANPDAEIDVKNANRYCAKCDKNLMNRDSFVKHLKMIHHLTLPKRTLNNPNAAIDIHDPNFYCAQCEKRFAKKRVFVKHLKGIHGLDIKI